MLEEHGHTVEKMTLSNKEVNSLSDKLKSALGVIYNPASARIIEKKILEFRPDVIHVHNFFPLISPAVFYVAHKLKVPVVMTLHNYRLVCPSAYLHYNGQVHIENVHKVFPFSAIMEGAYRDSRFQTASVVLATGVHKLLGTWRHKVDRFITLTSGAADLFLNSSLKLKPEQLVVKPNFTADLGLSAAERENYFLYVGRLSPEKGLGTLLKASEKYPFRLKIIGDGSMREVVAQHAAKHPNVEYLGYQRLDRVVQELKMARALVFTSEWPEMFGMSIIEAFSTGTPVIASSIGGGGQLVQNGHNGLHYTPGDADELIHQVKALEQDTAYAQLLGQNARLDYEANYTPEANYHRLLQIYREVTSQRERPAGAAIAAPAGL